ncbi:uncharacterized protein LOC119672242 [Teleopsis dalmanni]|uniref:uncharacterized protein LOC119668805 n=1 Tax=Teleopsis dalmanni TaxID=139649 RepID=UPI000D32B024|nr:uncharacterized protein LOC119668805 [Teleopsis dalmanni]XP_037939174.1 uncharacterized protein LOC119672242 [Teleopsis dalmanni]XP_037939175.1 uncharacterized protein LOC119672242 [Teleopsis dalmanni]
MESSTSGETANSQCSLQKSRKKCRSKKQSCKSQNPTVMRPNLDAENTYSKEGDTIRICNKLEQVEIADPISLNNHVLNGLLSKGKRSYENGTEVTQNGHHVATVRNDSNDESIPARKNEIGKPKAKCLYLNSCDDQRCHTVSENLNNAVVQRVSTLIPPKVENGIDHDITRINELNVNVERNNCIHPDSISSNIKFAERSKETNGTTKLPNATDNLTTAKLCARSNDEKKESTMSTLDVTNVYIEYKQYNSELQMHDIMRLIQAELSEPYSIYTYRYFIYNWPKLCFLAAHGNEYVGAIVCKLDMHASSRRGYIAMLAVRKEYRKLKIGTTLVQKAIEAMLLDNADEVVLETEMRNIPALRLYENLGFVRDKRLFRYYLNGVDALRLKLWFSCYERREED